MLTTVLGTLAMLNKYLLLVVMVAVIVVQYHVRSLEKHTSSDN